MFECAIVLHPQKQTFSSGIQRTQLILDTNKHNKMSNQLSTKADYWLVKLCVNQNLGSSYRPKRITMCKERLLNICLVESNHVFKCSCATHEQGVLESDWEKEEEKKEKRSRGEKEGWPVTRNWLKFKSDERGFKGQRKDPPCPPREKNHNAPKHPRQQMGLLRDYDHQPCDELNTRAHTQTHTHLLHELTFWNIQTLNL